MEQVHRTANVSLRYGISHISFENEASSSAMTETVKNTDNDVDFDDVFGGPPTRTRYSFGGGRIKSSEESTSSPFGLGERPVFGESYSSPRRRTSDDFYDDIFRRSDESVRSPMWCSPTPGSRTLSPAHPEFEPYATSIPSEFSLSAKLTKAVVDVPVFASNVHTPTTPLSRFSSPSRHGRDIFRSTPGQSPGQTLLSCESSGIKESQSTENEIDYKPKHRTRTGTSSGEFHFSIHKWANVGVPLLISTLKGSSKVSDLSMDNMQDAGFANEDLSAKKEDMDPLSGIGLTEVIEKETLMVKEDITEHEVIPPAPSSLFNDEIERQGYEEAGRNMEMSGTTGKKKVEAKKMNSSKKTEANKPVVGSPRNRVKGMVKDFFKLSNQESPPKTKTNDVARSLSSRWKTSTARKEVADSISNLDSTFPEANVEMMPDASNTAKLARELPAENVKMAPDASSTIPLDSKVPADNVNTMPDTPFTGKEHIGKSNKQKFARNRTIKRLEDIYFHKDASPASESVPYGSKASVESIGDHSLDNFQVEELPPVEDEFSKTQQESEAIKALDSKIHLWSSGRKGNIRSLLSTLQLVLWAESGWKPVALVDIIETNAVKKAYNRAMLCLHPDKLQQKGADSHKKYMAEKVFDILQEAWDHFNSLGTLL